MLRTLVRLFSLTVVCAVIFSCGDAKSYLKDQMVNTLTDTAINSAKNSASDTTSSAKTSKKGKSYSGSATGDAQFIEDDVIFVAKEEFKGSGYIHVMPSRLETAPSAKTKNEGQYMIIESGDEIWTKFAYKTRIAKESEIKIGAVFIFIDNRDEGVCQPPESKEQANSDCCWYMAKVTDVSDKYRGYVTLSGGWKVSPEALRKAVK